MAVNTAGARMLGYESASAAVAAISDSPRHLWLAPEDRERYVALMEEHGEVKYYPCQLKRADGSPIWISVTARRIAGPDGKTLFYQGFLEDLTEQKNLEAALKATIRELQLLSEMNNALAARHHRGRSAQEYCRVMVETGGYRMAWVGFAENGSGKRIGPVASLVTTMAILKRSIPAGTIRRAQRSNGRCIKSGQVEVTEEILNDPPHGSVARRCSQAWIQVVHRSSVSPH